MRQLTHSLDNNYSNADPVVLDINNEIVVDQVFDESKTVHTAWSEAEVGQTDETTVSGRLSTYKKDIDTTRYSEALDETDTEYLDDDKIELNWPTTTSAPSIETTTTYQRRTNVWQPAAGDTPFRPYVEIDRSVSGSISKPVSSVETVEITESIDYSEPDIIYDDTKVGFKDDSAGVRNFYAIPVSASLNLPEQDDSEGATATESTTITNKRLPTTSFRDTTTTVYFEPTTTSTATTTLEELTTTVEELTTSIADVQTTTDPSTVEAQDTTESAVYEEIFLGGKLSADETSSQQGPIISRETGYEVINLNTNKDNQFTNHKQVGQGGGPLDSPHKIPNSLWSVFDKSRHEDSTTTTSTTSTTHSDEVNTEGFSLASTTSYAMPESSDGKNDESKEHDTVHKEIVEIDDLPKPSSHESEVLVIERLVGNSRNNSISNSSSSNSRLVPKSFELGGVAQAEHGTVKVHTFGAEQLPPVRKPENQHPYNIADGLVKKREEWMKNWVSRKFNKNKFPRGPFSPVTPFNAQGETTTPNLQEDTSAEFDSAAGGKSNQPSLPLSFAPTIPPPTGIATSSGDATIQPKSFRFGDEKSLSSNGGGDYKSSIYDKYTRNNKLNSLFAKKDQTSRNINTKDAIATNSV